jgi:sister chromatid cohesion protein DCC1
MELVPQAPALGRIRKLLQPTAWKGLGSDWDGDSSRARKRRKLGGACEEAAGAKEARVYTMDQMRSVIQASEAELQKGLRERNVVEVDGKSERCPHRPSIGKISGNRRAAAESSIADA